MNNKEAADFIRLRCAWNNPNSDHAQAKHAAISALESIDELKRLCEKIDDALQSKPDFIEHSFMRGQSWILDTVLSFLDGDPTDLKILADEK
jgi:hypothetical protein